MAVRMTQFPFEFSDRTTESSTEENLTQLQHGEVSVHTALQAWQERLLPEVESLHDSPALTFLKHYTLSIPDPIPLPMLSPRPEKLTLGQLHWHLHNCSLPPSLSSWFLLWLIGQKGTHGQCRPQIPSFPFWESLTLFLPEPVCVIRLSPWGTACGLVQLLCLSCGVQVLCQGSVFLLPHFCLGSCQSCPEFRGPSLPNSL